jgi:hypothetical protein
VQTPFASARHNPAVVIAANLFNHPDIGQPDIAVTNGDLSAPNGSVTIYKNTTTSTTGDITFQQTQDIPVGKGPIGLEAAQLTNDGLNDLVVANAQDGTISVLLNDPNNPGTFQPPVTYTVGGSPFSVIVGQFTASGNQDILVGTSNDFFQVVTDSVSLLLGNGNGTFQPAIQLQTGGMGGQDTGALPSSGNHTYADIVVANFATNNISVLASNGDGTFQPPVFYSVGAKPYTLAIGDINNDGYPDIITANQDDGTVSILLNDGTNKFPMQMSFPAGGSPADVLLGNFRGDNVVDIVVTNQLLFGGGVSVLYGNGDGTFGAPTHYNTGTFTAGMAVADYNGDGFPDIVVANAFSDNITVLRNDGTPNPQPPGGGSADVGVVRPVPEPSAVPISPANVAPLWDISAARPKRLAEDMSILLTHAWLARKPEEGLLLADFGKEGVG